MEQPRQMHQDPPYDFVPLQRLLAALDTEAREDAKASPHFIQWFDHAPLQPFRGMTARQVVEQGRAADLARYVISTQQGFVG
jgi:hypothetical protein